MSSHGFAVSSLYPPLVPRLFPVKDSRKSAAWHRRERVERLLARLFAGDPEHRRLARRIRRRQLRLRGALSASAWLLYLLLEEAEVGRWTYVVDRLAERALSVRGPLSQKRRSRR
jgi:hypothetical protein